ncbi:hypothetical protein ACWESM_18695 [Nocardia sp. NPDC003999]
MRTFDEIAADARKGSAFSNSTDWEIWQFNVCGGGGKNSRRCVLDDNDDCPLLLLALLGEQTPAEWTGTHARYECSEHTTPAQARAAEDAALQARIEAEHHGPLFEIEGGRP